jgi:hypothetical protein
MGDNKLTNFTLVGGTALALYMGHRKSIDIDLFSQEEFDILEIKNHLAERHGLATDDSLKTSNATLIGYIQGIKVDCIRYNYTWIEPIVEEEGIRLASLRDIAAMKMVAASQSGTRLKDFIDLAWLSTQ